jgi:NADH dehydrogenase
VAANANSDGTDGLHHVVIVGGGFGGLYAARALRRAPARVTLVDRRNFHLFQPLLYQVATGGLSPGQIAAPLRSVLERHRRTTVLLAEVVDVDPAAKRLVFRDGEISYDTLVIAAGTDNFYFGHDEWRAHAPGLKSVEEALEIRRRVLLAFEAAEREDDAERRRALLTFVVVGGGPTGVELAGALAEIARHTLRGEFRRLDPSQAHVILVEGADRVLPPFVPELSSSAKDALEKLGVSVRTGAMVRGVDASGVTLAMNGREELIAAHTVLWAAGVRPSGLARVIAERTGAELDKSGRVIVGPELTVPAHPEIFVIGDMAHAKDEQGAPLPGVAPVAMQEGKYVATTIRARLEGRAARPFRYWNRGTLATIGRSKAVADLRFVRLSGFIAWVLWLFIHLLYLVEFQNRVLVLIQWAWSYLTWDRGARLITGEHVLPNLGGREERAPGDARAAAPRTGTKQASAG